MATRTALALHLVARPVERRRPRGRAARLLVELLLAVALVAAGAIAALGLLLFLVVGTPLAAAALAWFAWRPADGASREARRVRARLRRKARALGLVVLAGSRPAVMRLAAAGGKPPAPTAP